MCCLFFCEQRIVSNFLIEIKMDIKILGMGCSSCNNLHKQVINTLAEMDIVANVTKEENLQEIMKYGAMRMPALVINEKLIFSGKVPTVAELKEIIQKNV